MLNIDELRVGKDNNVYDEGYRIVYFYENGSYSIGEFCRTIEGFMIGFTESNPIIDDDIPLFISNEDLLNRCLQYDKRAIGASIYKTDGTLICKIDNKQNKKM